MYSVVLVLVYSKVIQLYIHVHTLFHYGLLQDIEYSSLCYTVGPCCLSTLPLVTPNSQSIRLPPLISLGHYQSVLLCLSLSLR